MKKKTNLVSQQYLVSSTNIAWCSDFTQINPEAFLAFIMDLGSRLVLSHIFTEQIVNSDNLMLLVRNTLEARDLNPGQIIFHSDRGNQYTSKEFVHFAKSYDLKMSVADKASHQNQVAESFNKSIKILIKKQLLDVVDIDNFPESKHDSLEKLSKKFHFEELASIITSCIETYNSTSHGSAHMFKASPYQMDEALYGEDQKSGLALMAHNDNSKKALDIRKHRATVVEKYAGNWENFFLDWREEQSNQHHLVYEQNRKLSQQVKFLVKEAETLKAERDARNKAREKRANARKLPLRDAILASQFEMILEHTGGNSYIAARNRVAFILLYYTGLRVSNLLVLKLSHLRELWGQKETTLPLIKRGSQRHFVSIGADGANFLEKYFSDLNRITKNKELTDYAFTRDPSTQKNKALTALDRTTFEKGLNKILAKVSGLLGKNIRTHSFRASFVTDLLNSGVPIHKVKEVVGHKDIKSTADYQRSSVTIKEVRSIISAVNKSRKEGFKVKTRKRDRERAEQQSQGEEY